MSLAAATVSVAQQEELPDRMSVPDLKPKVENGDGEPQAEGGEVGLPQSGASPVPTERPQSPGDSDAPPSTKSDERDADAPMPPGEVACRASLRQLGVAFEEHEPLRDEAGCSAPHPVSVSRLSGDVELRPAAVLTCGMAEATARFIKDHANPLAQRDFDAQIAAVNQVSSYVCRPRNGTTTLSEHAFANALDWGSIELTDGTVMEIRAHRRSEPRRARLLQGIREAACGPFKTVLGPGSDADHADHFHFDLAERRNGGTFCQ